MFRDEWKNMILIVIEIKEREFYIIINNTLQFVTVNAI